MGECVLQGPAWPTYKPGRAARGHAGPTAARGRNSTSKPGPVSKASHPGSVGPLQAHGDSVGGQLLRNGQGMDTGEALASCGQTGHENKGPSHSAAGALSPPPLQPPSLPCPHTEPDTVQSLRFYCFTFSANKSRCKQGLFHINILTGLFFLVK